MPAVPPPRDSTEPLPARKAGFAQIAATMFWGMCMIGKRGTWEKDGVTISLKQAIIGAVIAGCVVIFVLVMLVRLALS